MIINGRYISKLILAHLRREIIKYSKQAKTKPRLVVFSVKAHEEDMAFIKAKQKAAKHIGASFEHILYKRAPRFQDFAQRLRMTAMDEKTNAIVIQKPLPPSLSTITLYDYIPTEKEIEGHKKKSPFIAPIGLTVLSCLKYIYDPGNKKKVKNLLVNLEQDLQLFKMLFKRKRVILIGRGETGGKPIGKTMSLAKINYININSKTPRPESFIKSADLVISAVGKEVIPADSVKRGSVLISVGIRKENNKWKGDYNENEIKAVSGHYTPTPGGVGPIDVAYLMHNLVEAWKIQNRIL